MLVMLVCGFFKMGILVDMISGFFRKYWPILALVLLGLLIYADLFHYMVKWDSLDQYLPFRYFLSYASDFQGPALWLPYQYLGYPVYGDMQSGFWYPLTWLHVLMGGYGFLSFNMEVIIHLILAGIGMYALAKRCFLNEIPAVAAGLAYMTCGHLVGTCHVLTFVISATWLPFVLFSLIDLRRDKNLKSLLKAALFIHLFVSGGYPAFSMILVYFMLLFFGHWFWKETDKKKYMSYVISLGLLVLILGGGYLKAQAEVFPWMGRSEALPYNEFFYHNSFTLRHWWSFLFPIMISTDKGYFASDLSMINAYVGVFIFLFALYGLLKSPHPWKYGLLTLVLFALAASAGPDTPLRLWLYDYVPGFNLFRHPALFRLYAIFGLILLGGMGFHHFVEKREKLMPSILLSAAVLVSTVCVYLNLDETLASWFQVYEFFQRKGEVSGFGRWAHLAFICVPISALLWAMYFISYSYSKGNYIRYGPYVMMLILVAEVMVTTHFSIPSTVINNIELSAERTSIEALPKSNHEQDAKIAVAQLNDGTLGGAVKGVWRNLGIWSRKTAVDGYNPFQLKVYDDLKKDSVLLSHGVIYTEGGEVNDLRITKNSLSAVVNMNQTAELHLIQAPYPGWHVYIDDLERELVPNSKTPSVMLQEGTHNVSFRFENRKILILFWLSMISFLLTLTGYCWLCRTDRNMGE